MGRGDQERGEKEVDNERDNGQNIRRPHAEALGGDVHQEKDEPGKNDAAIQGKPTRPRVDTLIG